jgi:signal transduction histidine kinase
MEQEPRPSLECKSNDIQINADRDRFSAVLEHLIQNAQEATSPDGYVNVTLWKEHQTAIVEIRDNGCGMDDKFIRDRLFRPFDSTKGQGGMGIGAYESRDYVRELNGDIQVKSEPGQGSTFRVEIPVGRASNS